MSQSAPPVSVRRRPEERGIALLVVLLLALILIPFAGEFAYQVSLETRMANNVTDQLKIDNAIDGQFEIVLARLEHDAPNNEYDSYEDIWNEADIQNRTDEKNQVTLETTVSDEQGKLNLNMLARGSDERKAVWKERLKEVIKRFRRDTSWDASSYADELAEDIFRWVNNASTHGNIPTPKTIDDRKLLVLEELNFINDRFEKEKLLEDRREGDDVAPGLHRYITVYGSGKLNLNTADKIVLQSVFHQDPDIADRIIERRDGLGTDDEEEGAQPAEEEDPEESGDPFTDVQQVMEIEGVNLAVIQKHKIDLAQDFDVRSNFFSMRITGTTDITRREELFAVERVPSSDPEAGLDGFRFLLIQERTDPLEDLTDLEERR